MVQSGAKPAMTKSTWADLPRRLGTICIGVPLVWMLLSSFPRVFFMGAHALSLWEFVQLEPKTTTLNPGSKLGQYIYCSISVMLATMAGMTAMHLLPLLLCIVTGTLILIGRHHWIVGYVMVTIPFSVWQQLAPRDFASTVSLLLVVWNCDTGALLAGRLSRKTIAVPGWIQRISPAKSMEGFLGGILGGTWTAISWIPTLIRLASIETSPEFDELWGSFSNRLALGVLLSMLAIMGDLVESAIKRQSKSKDSGSILPGHGGVLDRFDSSLLSVLLYQVLLEKVTSA